MAINPFRIGALDLPANPQPVPLNFSFLSDIGNTIGQARLRDQIGALTVTDAKGNVDYDATNANLARAGLLGPEALQTAGYRRQQLAESAADRAALEQHRRALEETARITAERPQYQFTPPGLVTPGSIIEAPRVRGQPPTVYPWPTPASAGAGPGGTAPMPGPMPAPQPDPSFAGPGATAAPAPMTGRNEAYLRTLPAGGQALVKGLAEYQIDPAKANDELLAATRIYRPDFNMSEYAKHASPPSGEIAARMGMARGFLERLPDIRPRIEAGELTSMEGRGMAMLGQGGPGELRRAIDEGADAILRGLTGAGMNISEAANYARRYQFSPIDTRETSIRKLNELEAALRYVNTEVGKGRGGDDFLKGFTSQFGLPVAGSGPAAAPAVGEVRRGYRFKGGDPSRQENWEAQR